MIEFFDRSELLDYEVLKPLSHIRGNWEISTGTGDLHFEIEEDSFAKQLNSLIDELDVAEIPSRYHDNEDVLAEYARDTFNQEIRKVGSRWVGSDYRLILQDGGILDIDEQNLIQSAKGRINAAIERGQKHYDDMDSGHRQMLALVLTLVLYHRAENA